MDMDENESAGKENRPTLNLEDDDPKLDHTDFPLNPKKQLNLELGTTDLSPDANLMKVYLRIRPFFNDEIESGEDQNCFCIETDKSLVAHAPKDSSTNKNGKGISQKFTFSKIFSDSVGQKQFFEEAVLSTVKEFVRGQNSLVFTYGVTNSGKTYTMQGIQKDVGILPRSLDVIFNSIKDCQWTGCMLKPHMFCDVIRLPPEQEEQERKMKTALLKLAELEENDTAMTTIDSTMSEDSLMRHSILDSTSGDSNCDATEIGEVLSGDKEDPATDMDSLNNIKFSVWISFAEIYNENVHDLFAPMVRRKTLKGRPVLLLREDKNGTPYIRGLHEIHVTSAEEAYKLLTVGKKNLQVACTKLNRNSSRSHCIFTIKMLRIVDDDSPSRVKMSMLSFCDLAGSERCTKTQSMGERIKEAGNINTSLLTLGRCIKILRHNQVNKEHPQVVPFRESKLTRLLQSFFCGKGQASMIVNINSCASTFDETMHVLSYSAIAKQVIVVQEPERVKKKKHSSRQFSMLLEQRCRDTIGWATPGTCAKLFEEEKTLLETEEDDEESEDEDTESETERERNLMELVRMLKEQLLEEKQKQLLIEARVREEVCKEVSEQVNKIESYYSDRLKQERASVEEKAEKRLEIYIKSLHRSRKRQRLIDDAEVEEAEHTKVQQYEKEIEELKDQLAVLRQQNEQLKAAATTASKQRDQLQQENTSIKFHMSDLEIKLEKSETSKLDQSMANSSACEPSDLASKLSETERELEKQRQMVTKLQQVIDMLQCNAADGECKVKEAKKEIDQKTKQVTSLEEELIGKNTKIEELKNELLEKDGKLTDMSSVLLQQEKQLEDLQKTVDQITDELDKLQQENSSQDDMLITMHRELEELRKKENKPYDPHNCNKYKDAFTEVEKNRLLNSDCTTAELTEEKAQLLSQVAELRDAADKYKEQAKNVKKEMVKDAQNLTVQQEDKLENMKHELELLTKDKQKLEIELQAAIDLQKEYEAMDEAKEKELDSAFAMNDQLKDELKQSKQAIETLKTELIKLQQDFELVVTERNELRALLEKKDAEIQDGQALCEELRMELSDLQNGLEQAKHNIKETENDWKDGMNEEIKSLREKLGESEKNVEMVKESLKEVEKALIVKSNELEKAQTLIRNKDSDIEKLQENLEMTRKLHKENQQQLEDYIVKVNEQVVINGDLTEQLQERIEEKSNLENQLAKLQEEKVNRDNELENLRTELKFQKDHLDRKRGEYESRLSESELQVKKLQEKIKQMAKQEETKLNETIAEMEKRYSALQASMETMAAETAAECTEHEEMMNKTHLEMQEKSAKIAQLETELQHLQMLTGGKDRDRTDMETMMEEEKQKVTSLVQKLNDAEYKHQILCRQLRREKSNVEKLLKTAEEERDAQEKQINQLQSELNEMKQKLKESENEHENQLETYKARALKLEAVIEDLELCLQSSKEHEAKSLRELENIRQKCKHLENDCNNKEDTICSLNDELERVREESMMTANLSNAESTAQMESLRREVMESKKIIDDLEVKINQLKEERDMYKQKAEIDLQATESNVRELEVAKRELENELKNSMIKVEELTGNLESVVQELNEVKKRLTESEEKRTDVQNKLTKKESECEQLNNDMEKSVEELSEIKIQYDVIKKQLEEANCEMHSKMVESDEQLRDIKYKLDAKEHDLLCCEEKVSEFATQLSTAKDTVAGLEQKLAQMQSDSSLELKDLQSQLIGKCNELAECHDKIEKQGAQLEELRKINDELNMKLTEKQLTSTEEVKRLEDKLKIFSDELVESRDRENKHVKMCSELEEKCIQLEKDVKELKDENESLQQSISEKTESELIREDKIKGLEKKYKDLENQYQVELLQAKTRITELETELEKKEKHILELNETVQCLRKKLDEQTPQVEECTLLKSQIVVLENKLVSLESTVSDAVSMKTKFENLESELQKQLLLKAKAERTIKSLQEEVDELERRLKQNSSLSKDKFKLQEEVKTLQDELTEKQKTAKKERRLLEETIEKLEQENKTLNSESETLLKKLADLKQLEEKHLDELGELQRNVEDTEKQLNEALSRVKALEDELETCKQKLDLKEGKLKSRTEALSGFMVMMDQEKEQCEAALADAKANERVIEQLKKTLELQEAAMQDQDTCLMNKEEEIIKLGEELQEKAERCLELQKKEQDYQKEIKLLKEESKIMKQKIKVMEASLSEQNVNDELEMLRRAKNRAEEKLAKAKAKQDEAEKQLRERVRYEADLKETNEELQKVESLLKERDEEIKLIRKQYEELKKQQSESNHNIQHEKETDSNALKILKTKFHAKEELVRQLEQEKLQWKERAEMIKAQKEQELIKWRSERDKLVVQIEKVIKEKEQQIAALQDSKDASKLVELQQKIEEQEQIIKELSSRMKKTAGRSRKQRHKNAESSSTDDETEQIKKELCFLQKQLDQERNSHKEEMNKIIKAKDCVIDDMRQQNYKLASQLSDEEPAKQCNFTSLASPGTIEQSPMLRTRTKHGTRQKITDYEQVTGNQNVTSTLNSAEHSEPVPRIRAKRGRTQKTKCAEIDQDDDVSSGKRGNKRERKPSRSVRHHNRSSHLDENNDPSLIIIPEDDVIDLDEPASKKSGVSVLVNSTNITDLGKSVLSTPKRLDSSLPDATSSRRKKRLRSTVDKPLAFSPEEEIEQSDAKAVHDIVRRKLRSRKK